MANTADPLTQLKDIHLPDPVGWWPLANGWYVLIVLSVVFVLSVVYFFYRRNRQALAKNKALKLLRSYLELYEQNNDAQWASARISELLKRVALVYFPREQVAGIYGKAWIDFLNNTSKGLDFYQVEMMLLDLPFKSAESPDLKPLFILTQSWIKQRGAPCLN